MHIFWKKISLNTLLRMLLIISCWLSFASAQAAPESEALTFWDTSNEKNLNDIDHKRWQTILNKYLIGNHSSGVNRFDYKRVSTADKKILNEYLLSMQALDPRSYSRATQKAYWINLYNALTIKVVLDEYPVTSITKIGESFFSFGPWDDKVATIQGQPLTLNHIEHGILRPLWGDNRIHYAVNCASISCPNLSAQAFTSANTEQQMEQLAIEYVNHLRGVKFEGDQLIVSSIYHWYLVDFGNNDASLLLHLQKYAKAPLKEQLKRYKGDIDHDYDWKLNQP